MADLRNKILEQEKEIKILKNDSAKENTKYRFKQHNFESKNPKVLFVKKILKALFIILLIIFAFLLHKIYRLPTPYEDKKKLIILISIAIVGVIIFNILEKFLF